MRRPVRRRWLALLTSAAVVGAAFASISLAAGGGTGPTARAAQLGCSPTNPQPAQPLEMNTVAVAGVAKTVAMEKELFECHDAETGDTVSRDVETFVELIERGTATNVSVVARKVLVATCDKNFDTGRVRCRTSSPPLTAPVTDPLLGCAPLPSTGAVKTPADPVEMNTVAIGDFVKTVKLEKDVLGCGNSIGDVYLFTEVIEKKTTGSAGYVAFANRFEGIMCRKDPSQGVITTCTRFTTN